MTIIIVARSYQQDYGTPLPFYQGWSLVHATWAPNAVTLDVWQQQGAWSDALEYFQDWITPVLGLTIFALFGTTLEARSTYWKGFWAVARRFGYVPRVESELIEDMVFTSRNLGTQTTNIDIEQGLQSAIMASVVLPVPVDDTKPLEEKRFDGSDAETERNSSESDPQCERNHVPGLHSKQNKEFEKVVSPSEAGD